MKTTSKSAKTLLPASKGDFRLGAEKYAKKLMYEEMVDIPLDRLLQIGYDDLRANQKKFRETAALISPSCRARRWRRLPQARVIRAMCASCRCPVIFIERHLAEKAARTVPWRSSLPQPTNGPRSAVHKDRNTT